MRWLGLDVGEARTGLALGDDETRLASPWGVLDMRDHVETLQRLRALLETERIEGIVVGIPRPLGDQTRVTHQARAIEVFAESLRTLDVPLVFENETLSSAQASVWQRDLGQKGKRDDLAACAILQTFLDKRASRS